MEFAEGNSKSLCCKSQLKARSAPCSAANSLWSTWEPRPLRPWAIC